MAAAFTLEAILSLNTKQFEKGMSDAKGKVNSFGGLLKSGLGAAAKAGAAAVGAASTAIVAIGKQAVTAYGEYEQLVGGIETLFGDAQVAVLKNASQAFKTAGLSANEYMETVTSFSASLLQSLGGDTEAAAQYADMAVRDMSDNANKMGTDMSAIQNAYQGFAKQNYTMLDNLKLGYGGTKTEMERLITDAEKLNKSFKAQRDKNGDLTMSYADIVDAIHIVQENMGITGTTAEEASSTIQGSIASAKAAYENWVTGLADENADIEELTNQLFDSIETAANNILPVVETVLANIGASLATKLPELLTNAVAFVLEHLPDILALGLSLLGALLEGIQQGFEKLLPLIGEWIQQNIIAPAEAKIQEFINVGQKIVDNIKAGIDRAWSGLVSWFEGLWNSLFGNRTVNVNVNRTGGDYYAIGLDYVPANGFPAILHRGEAVLTAREADEWRRGQSASGGGDTIINQYIETKPQSPVELAAATASYFEQARWALA